MPLHVNLNTSFSANLTGNLMVAFVIRRRQLDFYTPLGGRGGLKKELEFYGDQIIFRPKFDIGHSCSGTFCGHVVAVQ